MTAVSAPAPTQRILFWSAVMVGLLMLAWVIIAVARRRHQAAAASEESPSFSISSLRQMHQDGKLSDEEYERARAAVIARARGAMEANPPVMPVRQQPRPPGDSGEEDLGPELLGPEDRPPPPPQPPEDSDEDAGSDR